MKKIFRIIALAVIFSLHFMPVISHAVEYTNIIDEDFIGVDGTLPEGWVVTAPKLEDLASTAGAPGVATAAIKNNELYMVFKHYMKKKDEFMYATKYFGRGIEGDLEVQLRMKSGHTSNSSYLNGVTGFSILDPDGKVIFKVTEPGGNPTADPPITWKYITNGLTADVGFNYANNEFNRYYDIKVHFRSSEQKIDLYIDNMSTPVLKDISYVREGAPAFAVSIEQKLPYSSRYEGRATELYANIDYIMVNAHMDIQPDDIAAVELESENLLFSDLTFEEPDDITTYLSLPKVGKYGCAITWMSSNVNILNDLGVVFPQDKAESVTLTAHIQKGNAYKGKTFNLTVPKIKDVTCKTVYYDDFSEKSDGTPFKAGDTADEDIWDINIPKPAHELTGLTIQQDPADSSNLVLCIKNICDLPQVEDDYSNLLKIPDLPDGLVTFEFRVRHEMKSNKSNVSINNPSQENLFTIGTVTSKSYGDNWTLADQSFSGNVKETVTDKKWFNMRLVIHTVMKTAYWYMDEELLAVIDLYENSINDYKIGNISVSNQNKNTSLSISYYDDFKIYDNLDYKVQYSKSQIKLRNPDSISDDFILPSAGKLGTQITWQSDDENMLSIDPETNKVAVKRPSHGSGNKGAILTATVSYNGVSSERDIQVTVIEDITDEEKLNADMFNLDFPEFSEQVQESVTTDFILPTTGKYGSSIVWTSSDENVIKIEGNTAKVLRSTLANKQITLTASLDSGVYKASKDFNLTVLRDYGNNLAAGASVNEKSSEVGSYSVDKAFDSSFATGWRSASTDKSPYFIIDLKNKLKFNTIILSEYGGNINKYTVLGSNDLMNWTAVTHGNGSGERAVLSVSGEYRYVKFSVTDKTDGSCGLYEFQLYYAAQNDSEAVRSVGNLISIPDIVTANITLPVTGDFDTVISWITDQSAFISNTGVVNRPQNADVTVKLTVAVSKNGETYTRDFYVKVLKTSGSFGGIGGGGGGLGGGGGGISVPVIAADSEIPASAALPFLDVAMERWSYNYIFNLYRAGIVNGVSDNYFAPEKNISREEFTKMLVSALELTTAEDVFFADVDKGMWYYKYIAAGKKYGLINGIDDSTFGIGKNITRQDMAAIVYRAVKDKISDSTDGTLNFSDNDKIADYAKKAVFLLNQRKIIEGFDDLMFKPDDFATREQATKVIYLVLDLTR